MFGGVTAGIVFALDKKSVQTHLEDIYQKFVEERQALQAEQERALSAESGLFQKIETETNRAKTEEESIKSSVLNEANRARAAEQLLQTQINTVGVGNKAYLTYTDMDADKVNIISNSKVTVTNDPDSSKNGDYQYNGTTFIKSNFDVLTQAKTYADTIAVNSTNINLYRGIAAHPTQYNAIAFDKSVLKADYAPAEIRYKELNVNGGFTVPFNDELRSKVQVWVKVKSANLNSGTMRFLVQAVKKDNSTFMSVYGVIANGSTGWIKLGEASINEANRVAFSHLNIQPHVVNGAELVVEDFYIGESIPSTPFVRVAEPIARTIARTAERKSLLPHWTKYPTTTGVAINENGDITIPAGGFYTITIPVDNVNRLYYCAYIDQANTGDCRLYWRGYRTGLTTFHDVPYFPMSVEGNEFIGGVTFDSTVSSVKLDINNYSTTNPITLRSFELCYDSVAPNGKLKAGDRLDLSKVKSEVIQTIAIAKPQQNYSSFPNFEALPKNSEGKRLAISGVVFAENVQNGNIKKGVRYYVSLPDSVANLGTGTAKLTVYHNRASDNVSLGGVSVNFMTNSGALNASIITTAETGSLNIRIDLTGDATVELGRVVISEVPYTTDILFNDYFVEDKTGTVISDWQYPKLTGYSRQGLAVDYTLKEEDGEKVLTIPNTAATGYGQGIKWIVDLPEDGLDSTFITFRAKLNHSENGNPTKIWIRYFREGSTTEMSATLSTFNFNRDGTWALNRIWLPKQLSGYRVKYAEVFLYIDSTATAPLELKRFIQSEGIHNPYVKFIKYVNEKPITGMSEFSRLKDALAEQPQTIFSVGRQIFRPLKETQQNVSDYELIGGNSLLPKRLDKLRYINTDGYLIAFIDRDDTVYLKKGNALYKTDVDDLVSRCVATSTVGEEARGIFNSAGLTLINANAPSGWLRVTANGTFVMVSRASASYSTDGGITWTAAIGYQDVNGEHYNAWGTDCSDNIIVTSGYKLASEGRGKGRVNYSNDNGKTYQVILDLEISTFIDDARRGSMHIHSVKYDPYWNGVWVIMGDGAFQNPNTAVTSNLWFIENPGTPEQTMISYDCRGQDWLNEQHVSVHPMQDCILFGSDANPTALYRMARTKNVNTLRDVAVMISPTSLSHYGCSNYQHKNYLPMTIYFGKASEYTGNLNDKVFLTYDGVNIVEIYTEPETSNTPSGKVNAFAYALDKNFIFERRTDSRFSSGNTWIVSDIRYIR